MQSRSSSSRVTAKRIGYFKLQIFTNDNKGENRNT
jgi:hypothetical protein